MEQNSTTPGFNARMTFRFSTDRNGRKRAHYWSNRCHRWMPAKYADAEMFCATGQADKYEGR